jgi:glycosylphosphatidylinositol transamidase (GPIT) subunit GPI8
VPRLDRLVHEPLKSRVPLRADLIDLLRQQSLSATDHFTSISSQLRRHLSKDSYALVRDHIDNLQFRDAANALEASLQ